MRKAFRGDLPQQIQSKVLNELASRADRQKLARPVAES